MEHYVQPHLFLEREFYLGHKKLKRRTLSLRHKEFVFRDCCILLKYHMISVLVFLDGKGNQAIYFGISR